MTDRELTTQPQKGESPKRSQSSAVEHGGAEPLSGISFARAPFHARTAATDPRNIIALQRTIGNQQVARLVTGTYGSSVPGLISARSTAGTIQKNGDELDDAFADQTRVNKVAFVREEGLNLREQPNQSAKSLTTLPFGQRMHTVYDAKPLPGWEKVAVHGQVGYVYGPRIHFPPEELIKKDPGLQLIKVKPGQTFWGLVKSVYGIQGNESTKDQNINHFINAIRSINKPEAFNIRTDSLDDLGNLILPGRDATDTYLIAGVDLWIPSFGVASRMDVGSGTVRGELTRLVKKVEQKIEDFRTACQRAGKYIPAAVAEHAGETAKSLLDGLIKFALEAAGILAASTAAGALIGALFGGVGAIPGAEIGFEVGLLILEAYGLAVLIEAILGIAGNLLGRLGEFIGIVWEANGDPKQLDLAGRTLADAVGILASAALIAVAAYLTKKGGEAFAKTKFAKTLGETEIAKWLKERQALRGSQKAVAKSFVDSIVKAPKSIVGKTAEAIAKLFNDAGFKATVEQSTKKGTSGKAVQVRVEGHPEITNIQFHPGGGRHTPDGVPYWKISTNKGKIWVAPRAFKGAEQLGGTIVFYD